MEESIGYDYPWMDKYPDTAMVIYQVVISLGIFGRPRKDEEAKARIYEKSVCCKNFLLLCHYRVYFTSNWVVGRLCNAVQIQMPFNQSKGVL